MKASHQPSKLSLQQAGQIIGREDPGSLLDCSGIKTQEELAAWLDCGAAGGILDYGDAWSVSDAEHRAGRPCWQEIVENTFYELLGVVPPMLPGPGMVHFLVGECHHCNERGEDVYLAAKRDGGRCYVKMMTVCEYHTEFPRSV